MGPKAAATKLAKKYGKEGAILYCNGRIDQAKHVLKQFEDNSSYAILNDWEDELKAPLEHYKEIRDILQGKKVYKQKRDGITLEELKAVDKKDLKRFLNGFELWQCVKQYASHGDVRVGDFVKIEEYGGEVTYKVLESVKEDESGIEFFTGADWDYEYFEEHYKQVDTKKLLGFEI